MNSYDATARTHDTSLQSATPHSQEVALRAFLTERLREDLGRIWERDDPTGPGRPGMAAQVEVVDELLRILAAGRLPARSELRILLFGYSAHPDFDQRWGEVLLRR